MELDDHEEQEEMGIPVSPSYDSVPNSSRPPKMTINSNARSPSSAPNPAVSERKSSGKYKECLKNHAVSIGGHAVDGCGEFMPAGEEGTLDALKCAACSCHRNFHRKETEGHGYYHGNYHHFSPYYRSPSGYLQVTPQQRVPLALPSTSDGGGSREDQEDVSNPNNGGSILKKRFRTKFTPEQKDKMFEFAERLGWRFQKHDEAAVQQFCAENDVKRQVLKVWMHNNKHTLGKKP